MIILDTNVVSELMRLLPEPRVFNWVASQPRQSLYVTTIVQTEILCGIAIMDEGKRKRDLQEKASVLFSDKFAGKVLAYGTKEAEICAQMMAQRRALGRRMELADALIAATALVHGASLATRDADDFEGCGVALVSPWREAA